MNQSPENQQNEPKQNPSLVPDEANQKTPEPIQTSTTNQQESQEKSEPEIVHFVGNIEVNTPVLDELVDRLVTVYMNDDGQLRMKYDAEFLPETLEPIVAVLRNVSSHDVMQVHSALTEKNVFLRKNGSCWALRGFLIAVTEERAGVLGSHELDFQNWDYAQFAWDNGTITITIDGHVGTLTNCGPFAKLMLTRLAPDMDDEHKTIGLFMYDKFVFGFRNENNVSAAMRVQLDVNELNWDLTE